MSNRDFKGVWIPREIWVNKNLSLQEKCLLVEIDSLAKLGKCYASNNYFADFFQLSENRISKIISSLDLKGYIDIILNYDEKHRISREIKTVSLTKPIPKDKEKKKDAWRKRQGVLAETTRGLGGNDKTINNTFNSTSNNQLSKDNLDVSNNETSNLNEFNKKETPPPIKPSNQPDSLEGPAGPVEQPAKAINPPPEKQSPGPVEKQKLSRTEKTNIKDAEKLVLPNKYIEYWNEKGCRPMSKHKNLNAKVYTEAAKLFHQLENGSFLYVNEDKIDQEKLKRFKIDIKSLKNRKFTEQEIYKAIDNFIYENTPGSKSFSVYKPKDCRSWLLSEQTGHSWALINLFTDPHTESPTDPAVLAMYQKTLKINENDDLYPDLVKGVNVIISRKAEYDKRYGRYVNINIFEKHNFFRQHLNFLEKSDRKYLPNDILYMYHVNHWKNFNNWLVNKFNKGYTLFPTETMIDEAKQKFEENEKLAKVREKEEMERERDLQEFLERQRNRPANRFQVAVG